MIYLAQPNKLEVVTPIHAINGDFLGNVTLTFTRDGKGRVTITPSAWAAPTLTAHDARYLAAWLAQ